jgi:hypothetical protein
LGFVKKYKKNTPEDGKSERKGGMFVFFTQMRKFVCLLILLCSFLFAETIPVADANLEGARVEMEGGLAELDDDSHEYIDGSARSVGIFEYSSHNVTTAKSTVSFGWDVTAWTNHIDYNMGLWCGERIANGLYLNFLTLNLHILSDVGDTCTNSKGCSRIGAGLAFNSVITLAAAFASYGGDMNRSWQVFMALQNPTLEFFVVRKYVPISIGLGYNTDWFAFSPGHKFYLRAHGDLNLNITWARISASYSYSLLDTYDLKKGSKRFYLKIFFGPMGLDY